MSETVGARLDPDLRYSDSRPVSAHRSVFASRLERTIGEFCRVTDRWGYDPYGLMMRVAAILGVILGFAVGYRIIGWSAWKVPLVAVGTFYYPLYPLFLLFKRKVLRGGARSFFQDTVLFLLPTFIGLSWLIGVPVAVSATFMGLMLPLLVCLVRFGCLGGGCCFGNRSDRWGVQYSSELLRCNFHGPAYPVFPLQLIDAVYNALLFVGIFGWWLADPRLDWDALAVFFLGYGTFRLVADWFRAHHNRPKRGPLWESQWLALIMAIASLTWLVH